MEVKTIILKKKNISTLFTPPEKGPIWTEERVVRERRSELVLVHTDMEHLTVSLERFLTAHNSHVVGSLTSGSA